MLNREDIKATTKVSVSGREWSKGGTLYKNELSVEQTNFLKSSRLQAGLSGPKNAVGSRTPGFAILARYREDYIQEYVK